MEQDKNLAMALLASLRGQFIVSQALFVAIETLEKVEAEFREVSNISDMILLRDHLFPLYAVTVEGTRAAKGTPIEKNIQRRMKHINLEQDPDAITLD